MGNKQPWRLSTPSGDGFLLGVNYPWNPVLNYGLSFGGRPNTFDSQGRPVFSKGISDPIILKAFQNDMAEVRECNISVVRMWMFFDGRGGIVFNVNNGQPQEPAALGPHTLDDIRAVLTVAKTHNLFVVFSLLNHDWSFKPRVIDEKIPRWKGGGHGQVLLRPDWQQALLENVFKKIFEAKGVARHPNLLAYEFMNEPEWIVRELGARTQQMEKADMVPSPIKEPKGFKQFLSFVAEVRDRVHDAGARFTISSNRLGWAHHWLDVLQEDKGDYLQIHYWNKQGGSQFASDQDLLKIHGWEELQQRWGRKVPVVWAEFTAHSDETGYNDGEGIPVKYSLEQYLNTALSRKFAGAWPWSWGCRDLKTNKPVQYDKATRKVGPAVVAGKDKWGVDEFGGPDHDVLKRWAQTNKAQINPGAPFSKP
jgi:hypothetical protein